MRVPDFIKRDFPLARCSTLRVGGHADYFAVIDSLPRLQAVHYFATKNELDTLVVGRGSNILFSDAGFRGLIMRMNMKKLGFNSDNDELWVEAGAHVSDIVTQGEFLGFSGFEEFAGLPGTIGGAIYGNAGCYGKQFWDVIEAVKFFNGNDFVEVRVVPQFSGYRWSFFKETPNLIIVSAKLKFEASDCEAVKKQTRKIREKRQASQPSQSSAGCIFKNPSASKNGAGQLIDECGLKGTAVGRAQISAKHGNFFVNLGGASAYDFFELIKIAKSRVFQQTGILLEEEIIMVGEF